MLLSDCHTQHLFLLIGGNTLPNYVAAQLLASKDTLVYLVYSKGTQDQRSALSKTLNPQANPAATSNHYQIIDVPIEASNPANIHSEISKQLRPIPDGVSVGLHYTGGTKAMAVHAYRAIQDWQKEKRAARRACYTYLDASTLQLWAERSDWKGAQAVCVGNLVHVSFGKLLSLHRRDELKKPVRTEAIWPSLAQGLAQIDQTESLRKAWVTPWNSYKQYQEKDEQKLQAALASVRTDALHTNPALQEQLYQLLRAETQLNFPTTFDQIMQASPFARTEKPYYEMVKWLTGGWFEDYVFLHVQQLASRYNLHDLALNVQPMIGNKDFEFDVVAMRHYQLFAFSCTLHRDRTTCKHKLIEAVARARQLGGSERVLRSCAASTTHRIFSMRSSRL